MSPPTYTHDLLARTAAVSTSLVDMLRRLGRPLAGGPLRYLGLRLAHHGIATDHFVEEPLPPRPRRDFSRARLEEAAAHSSSIRDMLTYTGYLPQDCSYGHVRKKLDEFGIDTGHFTQGRRYGPDILSLEPLASAVAGSASLAGVLRVLGVADNGAERARVKRSVAAHAISTSHFTGQGHFLGTPAANRKAVEQILRLQEPGAGRTRTRMLRRALDELGVPRICAECAIGDTWQGRRLVLEIDHVNGEPWDNRRENLRYLCPSCHSQTSTFARRSPRPATARDEVE